MDLRALRTFVAVAEGGSFSCAASTLEIAQSALSRQVSALERELGGRLLHRTGRGVTPTELGDALLPKIRAILAGTEELLATATDVRNSPAGAVDVGLVPAVTRPLVGMLCDRLRRQYPRIRLRVHEAYSGQIEEALAAGRVELGIFNRYRRGAPRGAERLLHSEMLLLGGPTASLPPALPFRAVVELPLALPARPNSLTSLLLSLVTARGLTLNIAMEGGAAATNLDAVVNAGLFTIAPRHAVARDLASGTLKSARINNPQVLQTTWMAMSPRRPHTAAARVVTGLIRALVAELDRRGVWHADPSAKRAG